MKKLLTIFFIIAASTIVNAQNIDKLTLKGGVMTGFPDKKEVFVSTIRREYCVGNCIPMYEGSLKFDKTISAFGGIEFSPYELKLSPNTSLLPYLGVEFSLISSKYEYSLGTNYRGSYNIASLVLSTPLGFKLILKEYSLEILSFFDFNFYKKSADFVLSNQFENNKLIYDRNSFGGQNLEAFASLGFQVRYDLNKKTKLLLGYNKPMFIDYNTFSLRLDHVGNVYPYLYHQISLGLTYQLLSHNKKKTEE